MLPRSFLLLCLLPALVARAEGAARVTSRPIGEMVRPMTDNVTACLIRTRPDMIVAWLATLPNSSEERKVVGRHEGLLDACFQTNLSMFTGWVPQHDYGAMRPAVIRFLLKRNLPILTDLPPANIDQVHWYGASVNLDRGGKVAQELLVNSLGFCLAKTDWMSVHALVLAPNASRDEAKAFDKLIPVLGGCIPEKISVRMDRARLRAILEETAYHAAGGVPVSEIALAAASSSSVS